MTELRWGGVILGEWRQRATPRNPAMPATIRRARQRLNSLSKLSKYRRQHGLELGNDGDWTLLLANVIGALGQEVSAGAVAALRARLALPETDRDRLEGQIADVELMRRVSFSYRLRTSAQVGALLGVSSVEREEANVIDIDAVDESAVERRRRLDRQAKRLKRAALKAAPRVTQAEQAKAIGVSLSTLKRRNRDLNSVRSPSSKKDAQARDTHARVKKPTGNGSTALHQVRNPNVSGGMIVELERQCDRSAAEPPRLVPHSPKGGPCPPPHRFLPGPRPPAGVAQRSMFDVSALENSMSMST